MCHMRICIAFLLWEQWRKNKLICLAAVVVVPITEALSIDMHIDSNYKQLPASITLFARIVC